MCFDFKPKCRRFIFKWVRRVWQVTCPVAWSSKTATRLNGFARFNDSILILWKCLRSRKLKNGCNENTVKLFNKHSLHCYDSDILHRIFRPLYRYVTKKSAKIKTRKEGRCVFKHVYWNGRRRRELGDYLKNSFIIKAVYPVYPLLWLSHVSEFLESIKISNIGYTIFE